MGAAVRQSRVPASSPDYPDFARLLGADAWANLPPAVRDRFPANHRADENVRYAGTMRTVEATACGRILAWLARVFDTPVATHTGNDVRTVVRVYPRPALKGIVWERVYHFPGRTPVTVRSTKCLDSEGRLIESLGGGLRMRLDLAERNGTLTFTSKGYYVELIGVRFPLPAWLPPGTTHVIHTDEGGGRFRFTMYTEHPWFGRMYFQEGSFCAEHASAEHAPAEDFSSGVCAAERIADYATGFAAKEAQR